MRSTKVIRCASAASGAARSKNRAIHLPIKTL
jgi:hypothetical protein